MVRVLTGGQAAVNSIATRLVPQLQQQCSVSVLLVMYGLPRLLVGSIIAHELMHAYLRMRHVTGLPLQVRAVAGFSLRVQYESCGIVLCRAGVSETAGVCIPLSSSVAVVLMTCVLMTYAGGHCSCPSGSLCVACA